MQYNNIVNAMLILKLNKEFEVLYIVLIDLNRRSLVFMKAFSTLCEIIFVVCEKEKAWIL